jgi:hypothetical protein
MGGVPESVAPKAWTSVGGAAITGAILSMAAGGAALVSSVGEAISPWWMAAAQTIGAAVVAVVAAIGLALPKRHTTAWLLLAGAAAGLVAGLIAYATVPSDRWGANIIAAGFAAVLGSVLSLVAMGCGMAVRSSLERGRGGLSGAERAQIAASVFVALAWCIALGVAVFVRASMVVPSVVAAAALVIFGRTVGRRARRFRWLADVAGERAPEFQIVPLSGAAGDLEAPSLDGDPAIDAALVRRASGTAPFRDAPGAAAVARLALPIPRPGPLRAAGAAALVFVPALAAADVAQTRAVLAGYAWRELPSCTSWGWDPGDGAPSGLVMKARSIVPEVRLAVFESEVGTTGHRTSHLYVIAENERRLSPGELSALSRGIEGACHWDVDVRERTPVVAENAEIVPLDVSVDYQAPPDSRTTPENLARFAELITEKIEPTFRAGPQDRRVIGRNCWQLPILDGVPQREVPGLMVYGPPTVRMNGRESCSSERPVFPKLHKVDVTVHPIAQDGR